MLVTRIRMIGLALVAVFAMSAIATAAASAAEMTPFPNKFTAKSGASTFETKSGEKVKCSADSGTGEVTSATKDTATIKFTGCEAFGFKCKSAGAASGEIVLKVTSELVDIMKANKEVGNILTLEKELTIECSIFEKLKVKGSTLCPITPVEVKTKEFKLICKEKGGMQEPANYEVGGVLVKAPITETKGEGIKNFAFEQSGLEGTDTLTFEKEGEIKP
jgi:hypothetical protein